MSESEMHESLLLVERKKGGKEMKRYFCDMCKRELLVKSWRMNFSLYKIFVGTNQTVGTYVDDKSRYEICDECAIKVKERMKGL